MTKITALSPKREALRKAVEAVAEAQHRMDAAVARLAISGPAETRRIAIEAEFRSFLIDQELADEPDHDRKAELKAALRQARNEAASHIADHAETVELNNAIQDLLAARDGCLADVLDDEAERLQTAYRTAQARAYGLWDAIVAVKHDAYAARGDRDRAAMVLNESPAPIITASTVHDPQAEPRTRAIVRAIVEEVAAPYVAIGQRLLADPSYTPKDLTQ